ncbi:hypothetical protein GCM10009624_36020 [Gordonia sinesedis]
MLSAAAASNSLSEPALPQSFATSIAPLPPDSATCRRIVRLTETSTNVIVTGHSRALLECVRRTGDITADLLLDFA